MYTKTKITIFLFSLTLLHGCASDIKAGSATDFHAMDACQKNGSTNYVEPTQENSNFGTINSVVTKVFMGNDKYFPIITHVDCQPLQDAWQKLRLTNGKHIVRVMLNPYALGQKSEGPLLTNLLTSSLDSRFLRENEKAAQNLEINVESGHNYSLYMEKLGYDRAYWITEDGNVIAKTPNFKDSYLNN